MVKYVENDEDAAELAAVVAAGASATAAAEVLELLSGAVVGTAVDDEATKALKPCDPGATVTLDEGEVVVDAPVGEIILDNNVGMVIVEETEFFDNSGPSIETLSEVVTGVGLIK